MQEAFGRRFKHICLVLLALVAAAGWFYVIYNEDRAKKPVEIVKKHFVFYSEYSHGVWREGPCPNADREGCRQVTYTIAVKGCGPVTFDWRVFPGEDLDSTSWAYHGTTPRFDENKYPLYAVLSEDSRLIDSPALGKPLPQTCPVK
jgi:hypothetical protein